MDVLAILPIRNDAPYVANCLRSLVAEGLAVAVIDNDSTDELLEILARQEFRPHVVDYSRLPFRGSHEIVRVNEAVDAVAARLEPDWVIYVDADEVFHSYDDGERVVDVIAAADADGCNVVNFDEFVFLPVEHDYIPDIGGRQPMLHYYFFEPAPVRGMRARRHDAGFSMAGSGQHRVNDARVRLFHRSLVHRHYIFRSAEHARSKYPERRYLPEELARGMCVNREGYRPEAFVFPDASRLKRLRHPDDRRLDRSEPRLGHYWERSPRLHARRRALVRRVIGTSRG